MDTVSRQEFEDFKNEMRQQTHNGYDGGLIELRNLQGMFFSTDNSTEFSRLTDTTARVPSTFGEQIFIYNNAGTYKLYIYEPVAKVWKNVTIA